ncbi:alpha/beta hydrolase [Microbacterium sp. 22303]|uniref:alpha/beta hydrolase n=1 Tax=Microbacterium sp. 22303 TaxID=3453905 RepID=UPI003F829980
MTEPEQLDLAGTAGRVAVWHWTQGAPQFIAVIAHGYGEHARRYDHVVERLLSAGAEVYAPDHQGHGRSEGARVLIETFDDYAHDLDAVIRLAADAHPELPVVLIGHSMGGAISARYVQREGTGALAALVLSGPFIGGNPDLMGLVNLDPIPEVPIDPEGLSRDPATGQAYLDDEYVYHGPFLRETLLAIEVALKDIADGPDVGALPTIWLHGEDDPIAPYPLAATVLPRLIGQGGARKSYPGARHEIFNETNRDEVIGDVIDFLGRHVPTRR